MKILVKLGVLCATFLLLAGVSFAAECDCYEIILTDLDGPPETWSQAVEICFDEGITGSSIDGLCDPFGEDSDDLFLFFNPLNEEALTYHSNDGVCVAYLKFHGDNQFAVTGIIYGEGRASFKGHKVDESECIDE
jgi:hypothetical protein